MTERPRIAVIVYGSVLNPNDLSDVFTQIRGRVAPVKVSGFERLFNQEASWRETTGANRAVLNVRRNDDHWFNGILVADLTRSEFREFKERERGYRLTEVEREALTSYDQADIEADVATDRPAVGAQDLVLTTTGSKTRADIEPIAEYAELCRDGASQWGETFLHDFLQTTKTASGESISTVLS